MKTITECLDWPMGEDIEQVLSNLSAGKKLELSIALIMAASESIFTSKTPKLSEVQRKVFLQLGKGLSDEENWKALFMSRSGYFRLIEQLRILYEVEKKWQLVNLSKLAQGNSEANQGK